jgi:16S rRNA (cytidine1402-2'-O)-methyltransferase
MTGSLVLVATPIGNLGDVSTRARETLATATAIYCEDTRVTRKLLSAMGLASAGRLISLHQHNEATQAREVIARVANGETVVLVSDAGTPGVSDPGARVVAAVADAGLVVTAVPGPSAVITALVLSGLPTDRFCMEGFAPRDGAGRDLLAVKLADEERTVVIFESPNRLAALLTHLAKTLGDRPGAIARELTKLHEEVVRGSLKELATWASTREVRGECALVVGGAAARGAVTDEILAAALADELAAGATVRDAAESVSRALGVGHRRAYEAALSQRSQKG